MEEINISIEMKPIGYVHTKAETIPRNWTVSDVKGTLIINEMYLDGLKDIEPGQLIFVFFYFHRSPKFNLKHLRIKPPHRDREVGVFSTRSPIRPNPIGLSLLEVLEIDGNVVHVKGLDMLDQTPILDIKPEYRHQS